MALKHVIESVDLVAMGTANAYLIEEQGGPTLIDADFPIRRPPFLGHSGNSAVLRIS